MLIVPASIGLFGDGFPSSSAGFAIKSAIWFDGSADYLAFTPSGDGTSKRTGTFSTWCKVDKNYNDTNSRAFFSAATIGTTNDRCIIGWKNDSIYVAFNDGSWHESNTSALMRDPTAWFHLCVAWDTTQGTAADRMTIYINGAEITAFAASAYPNQNTDQAFSTGGKHHTIGGYAYGPSGNDFMSGYLAEMFWIDGTALTASSFGEYDSNGVWLPLEPSEITSYGTNGFHLKFDDPNLLGKSSASTLTPTVSHLGSQAFASGDTGNTVFVVSSAALGDAASNRSIVIAVGGARQTGGERNVSSVVVNDGSSNHTATRVVGRHGNDNAQEFWTVALPSGTSGTITATFSGSMVPASITWWRVLNLGQPISTDTVVQDGYTSLNITTIGQTGDVTFYALQDSDNAGSFSWSDATERAEHINITNATSAGHTRYSATAADYTFTSAESHTETLTLGGSGNEASFAAVTFSNNNSFTSTSLDADNIVVDTPNDDTTAEVTVQTRLSPDSTIFQTGKAPTFSNNNLTVSGNSGHVTLKTDTLTDGASKYVWEVTVTKHDTNIKIGAILPSDIVSGGEALGSNASTGQGWSFVADDASNILSQYRGTTMVANQGGTLTDGDMFHIEFNNATGDVYVWRKASGGSWSALNSGATVVNDDGANNGKTALAGAVVHLAGHLYQTSGTNLMTFNFSGPFDKAASSGYNAVTGKFTGVGNFATWNPRNKDSNVTVSRGNTVAEQDSTGAYKAVLATMGVSTGKWVWEVRHSGSLPFAGWAQDGVAGDGLSFSQITNRGDSIAGTAGYDYILSGTPRFRKFFDGSHTDSFATATRPSSDTLMYLLDADAKTLAIRSNNTTQSAESISGIVAPYTPYCVIYQGGSVDLRLVTDSNDFVNSIPAGGYKTLNTANLPAPTVTDPSAGYIQVLNTGANIQSALATARSGYGTYMEVFKDLDSTTIWQVRFSDDTGNGLDFESTAAKTSFAAPSGSNNFLGWAFNMNATHGMFTAEVSHSNGSDTNTAHSLGAGLKMAVVKITNTTGGWYWSHPGMTSGYNIEWNQHTTGEQNSTVYAGIDDTNVIVKSAAPSGTYRVIAIVEVAGFSSLATMVGNGIANGPFINTGMQPEFMICRRHTGGVNTFAYVAQGRNPENTFLEFDDPGGTSTITGGSKDWCATGFKQSDTSNDFNASGVRNFIWSIGRPTGGDGVAQAKAR